MSLNPKQQRFASEFLIDLNATQAAIRAGYSKKTAGSQGERLLKNAEIQAAVSKGQAERSQRTEITADWVLGRLVENVDRAMQATPVLDREGAPTGEYQYEGQVANRALELIGKHVGMFKEKVELTGKDGAPIETDNTFRIEFVRALPKPD